MRLINTSSLKLEFFSRDDEVGYAILSHRWIKGEEISLYEFQQGITTIQGKSGFHKIQQCCLEAARNGFQYLWVDTCCIDQSSSAELSEAINSMYRWYQQAKTCYAYLVDVTTIHDLAHSAWFTRGWTLQELIAPSNLGFFNRHWVNIGTKHGLQLQISEITGIPARVLRGGDLDTYSIAQRMSWAATRETTRPEDMAYCLLGLFDVNMPMLYGEGTKAFTRLQEEIIKHSNDHTIFAWKNGQDGPQPILASSPFCFRDAGNYITTTSVQPKEFMMTNIGLSISLEITPWTMNIYLALLDCRDATGDQELMPQARAHKEKGRIGIFLQQTGNKEQLIRTTVAKREITVADVTSLRSPRLKPLLLLNRVKPGTEAEIMYGFIFRHMSFTFFPGFPSRQQFQFEIKSSNQIIESQDFGRGITSWYYQSIVEHFPVVPVIISELRSGQSGPAISFRSRSQSIRPPFPAPPESLQGLNRGPIEEIVFGFDDEFCPVCVLLNQKRRREDDDALMQRIVSGTHPLDYRSSEDAWNQTGVCYLIGSRHNGMHVEVPFLQIAISITLGWRNNRYRAWIVDVQCLCPPYPALISPPPITTNIPELPPITATGNKQLIGVTKK